MFLRDGLRDLFLELPSRLISYPYVLFRNPVCSGNPPCPPFDKGGQGGIRLVQQFSVVNKLAVYEGLGSFFYIPQFADNGGNVEALHAFIGAAAHAAA